MGRIYHQLALYGLASATCFAMAIASERAAAAAPFVSHIHAIPELPKTKVFDQRTKGGQDLGGGRYCSVNTRILLRSDQPLTAIQDHYREHEVPRPHGTGTMAGTVSRPEKVSDLIPEWERYRKDPKVYLVEFSSPGTPGTEAECR